MKELDNHVALAAAGIRRPLSRDLVQALSAYDKAAEAHLRDCWFKNSDEGVSERYRTYTDAKKRAHLALDAWVGVHGARFAQEVEERGLGDSTPQQEQRGSPNP